MAFQDVAAQIAGGFAGAAGNPQAAGQIADFQARRQQQAQQAQQQAIAPLTQALQSERTRLALYANPEDPTKPVAGKEAEYNAAHDAVADIIGKMRNVLHPPPSSDPHGLGYLGARALDKLHITRDLAGHMQENQQAKVAGYNNQTQQQVNATVQATPVNPLVAQTAQMEGAGLSTTDAQTALRTKLGLTPKDTTEQERFVTDYTQRHPGSTPEDALKAYRDATQRETTPKPAGPLEAGGVLYGIRGEDGKEYLPDAKGNFPPRTPPEVQQIYGTVKAAQTAKQVAADRKEAEQTERQLRGLSAIAERQGRTEAFQEQMAAYRSDETTFRALDKQARDSEESAQFYENAAKADGNKSAFDTSLITDYTSILAKGGRKTQAEIAFAQKIGGLGLRTDAMMTKAAKGELPPEMRQLYVSYLRARADSERHEADEAKPDLPEVAAPQGPKTKGLKDQQKKTKDPLGVL